MIDKELIRRALMGDQEAQKECTEKGIALPCPFCNGEAHLIRKDDCYSVVCKDGTCIASDIKPEYAEIMVALFDWNTRPAPPVGRCGECKWYECGKEWYPYCNHPDGLANSVRTTDFCCCFEPKEEQQWK